MILCVFSFEKLLWLINEQAKEYNMCGGWKKRHDRVAHRGIWVKEKWWKEIQLE